jgi:hypothetical protein
MENEAIVSWLLDKAARADGHDQKRMLKAAAERIDLLQNELVTKKTAASAEKQACFRLGQKDMQENLIAAIRFASASFTNPIILDWFRKAEELVEGMAVK